MVEPRTRSPSARGHDRPSCEPASGGLHQQSLLALQLEEALGLGGVHPEINAQSSSDRPARCDRARASGTATSCNGHIGTYKAGQLAGALISAAPILRPRRHYRTSRPISSCWHGSMHWEDKVESLASWRIHMSRPSTQEMSPPARVQVQSTGACLRTQPERKSARDGRHCARRRPGRPPARSARRAGGAASCHLIAV